ncbi:MAG TPA: PAS domain S-box protein, partial [Steroidobacteraceae bacterium]|nr:PAS domain S-box protein [Steroidobacteraceae bacterium]
MTEQTAVPLVVLSPARDPVEAINSLLRRAGQPAHCTWIPALRDLGDALTQLNPQLLVHVTSAPEDLEASMRVRDQLTPTVPVLELVASVDEARIAAGLARGARDVVTLTNPQRLQAVVMRELRVFRTERALDATVKSAHDARSQLDTVLQRSNDAIIQVQEGIVIDVNPAWLELSGVEDGVGGQPVMDLFEESSHAALRAALAACLQGRWNDDHPLRLNALLADGSVLPIEVTLALGEHDAEPCVRLVVPSRPRVEARLVERVSPAVRSDPDVGLLRRGELLDAVAERLLTPS